jgi:cell wall-associated NlpC family hydrolase
MRRVMVVLLAVSAGGCAASRAVPAPFPGAVPAPPAPITRAGSRASAPAIVDTALALRGAPYLTGGRSPAGFDCSGFVWYVFDRQGVPMPRTVAEQWRTGRAVRRERIEPGDLVFFDTSGRPATHVGIAVGAGGFVHAPSSRGEVRVEQLGSSYWGRRFVGARRVD